MDSTKGIYVNRKKVISAFQYIQISVTILRELECKNTLDELSFHVQQFLDDMFDRKEITEQEWEDMGDEAHRWSRAFQ